MTDELLDGSFFKRPSAGISVAHHIQSSPPTPSPSRPAWRETVRTDRSLSVWVVVPQNPNSVSPSGAWVTRLVPLSNISGLRVSTKSMP